MSHPLVAAAHEGRIALGPELCTHAAIILPNVLSRSSASQLIGGSPLEHSNAEGRWLAGSPVAILTRLSEACAAAFRMPMMLLSGAPACCPVESRNWERAHSPATVVSSLIVTGLTGSQTDPPRPSCRWSNCYPRRHCRRAPQVEQSGTGGMGNLIVKLPFESAVALPRPSRPFYRRLAGQVECHLAAGNRAQSALDLAGNRRNRRRCGARNRGGSRNCRRGCWRGWRRSRRSRRIAATSDQSHPNSERQNTSAQARQLETS